ncbi:MAG: DUF1080 domain-containing protein [Chitinophagaceae bacterium]|nr:MAG: DUF1080 domain-containing protein [Chitinophagaceae bacterium]
MRKTPSLLIHRLKGKGKRNNITSIHKKIPMKRIFVALYLLIFVTACDAQAEKKNARKIFNGKDLEGWTADTTFWSVKDGSIVGEVTPQKQLSYNTFCIWKEEKPADFELRAKVRITSEGNSGIQYRSEILENNPHRLKGYQIDLDGQNNYSGILYEEAGRGILAMRGTKVLIRSKDSLENTKFAEHDSLKTAIHPNEWNELRIVVKGNLLQHYINDVLMDEVKDEDKQNQKFSGLIGLQLHVSSQMKVEFKDIYYTPL